MTYRSRIPVDQGYIKALGTAFYNFTYLEWTAIWIIVKLNSSGFDSIPTGKTASHIARALENAIDKTLPPLPKALRKKLLDVHQSFVAAIGRRNKLLHAHPYTAEGGAQQLMYRGGPEWTIETVNAVAHAFEDSAIEASNILHGALKDERP